MNLFGNEFYKGPLVFDRYVQCTLVQVAFTYQLVTTDVLRNFVTAFLGAREGNEQISSTYIMYSTS